MTIIGKSEYCKILVLKMFRLPIPFWCPTSYVIVGISAIRGT